MIIHGNPWESKSETKMEMEMKIVKLSLDG
jgi:hypothetical protein